MSDRGNYNTSGKNEVIMVKMMIVMVMMKMIMMKIKMVSIKKGRTIILGHKCLGSRRKLKPMTVLNVLKYGERVIFSRMRTSNVCKSRKKVTGLKDSPCKYTDLLYLFRNFKNECDVQACIRSEI